MAFAIGGRVCVSSLSYGMYAEKRTEVIPVNITPTKSASGCWMVPMKKPQIEETRLANNCWTRAALGPPRCTRPLALPRRPW
eukprot:4015861-Lingulodinium_polyedra.AAC.1